MKRVMIFIDGSNLYHALKNSVSNTKLDFDKFAQKLAGTDRELVRTYYYNAPVDQTTDPERYKKQQRFFAKLHSVPRFQVVLGRLAYRQGNAPVEEGVDISLAVDMLEKAYKNHYDVAVLVSGDGDFARVIQAVKDAGKQVEVAFFQKCYHLKVEADLFVSLEGDYLDDCWST